MDSFLSRSEGLVHAEGAPTRFVVASGGVLPEGCGHDGSGVCLGDGQTEAEGVPSQGVFFILRVSCTVMLGHKKHIGTK